MLSMGQAQVLLETQKKKKKNSRACSAVVFESLMAGRVAVPEQRSEKLNILLCSRFSDNTTKLRPHLQTHSEYDTTRISRLH